MSNSYRNSWKEGKPKGLKYSPTSTSQQPTWVGTNHSTLPRVRLTTVAMVLPVYFMHNHLSSCPREREGQIWEQNWCVLRVEEELLQLPWKHSQNSLSELYQSSWQDTIHRSTSSARDKRMSCFALSLPFPFSCLNTCQGLCWWAVMWVSTWSSLTV